MQRSQANKGVYLIFMTLSGSILDSERRCIASHCNFFFFRNFYIYESSVDPDKMLRSAASDLCLQCLPVSLLGC